MPTTPPDEIARRLGERMYRWRTEQSMSQQEAAEKIRKVHQQWSRWERSARDGRNPTLENIILIAEAMDVELPRLIADLYWPESDETPSSG